MTAVVIGVAVLAVAGALPLAWLVRTAVGRPPTRPSHPPRQRRGTHPTPTPQKAMA